MDNLYALVRIPVVPLNWFGVPDTSRHTPEILRIARRREDISPVQPQGMTYLRPGEQGVVYRVGIVVDDNVDGQDPWDVSEYHADPMDTAGRLYDQLPEEYRQEAYPDREEAVNDWLQSYAPKGGSESMVCDLVAEAAMREARCLWCWVGEAASGDMFGVRDAIVKFEEGDWV